jgi:hypothetical protein
MSNSSLTLSQYLHGIVVGAPDGQILVFQGELDPAKRQATRVRDQTKKRGVGTTGTTSKFGQSAAATAGRHSRASSTNSVDSEDSEDAKARQRAAAEAAGEWQRETIFTLLRKIDTGLGTRFSAMVKAPGKEVLVTVMEVCCCCFLDKFIFCLS